MVTGIKYIHLTVLDDTDLKAVSHLLMEATIRRVIIIDFFQQGNDLFILFDLLIRIDFNNMYPIEYTHLQCKR